MPIVSKYSNEKIESITNKLHSVLLEEDANLELSLMVTGNLLSHILNTSVADDKKAALVEEFSRVLKQSTQK